MTDPIDLLAPDARARLRSYYHAKIDDMRQALTTLIEDHRPAAPPSGRTRSLQSKIEKLEANLAALGPGEMATTYEPVRIELRTGRR